MSYVSENDICDTQGCCPLLVTDTTHLLPFQIISNGSFMKLKYSPHGEDTWTIITIVYSEVVIDGFYYISYNGNAIDELECGAYDFKLTAGETWYFEPIKIEDFTITENAYTLRNELMLPLKFSEQQFETLPLIAPCDAYLPFMFATENATSGTVTVYLYDVVAECEVTEIDIDVEVLTISGMTYYIFEGECVYPFLECGIYKIEIVDGEHSYFSVPFDVECNMSDIPDGYRPMLDFNRCVMRDAEGDIMYESCTGQPNILDITVGDTAPNEVLIYFDKNIDTFSIPDVTDFVAKFSGSSVAITTITVSVDGDGNSMMVSLLLIRAILSTESGTLDYTNGTTPIISLDNAMPIGSFYDQNITNNV